MIRHDQFRRITLLAVLAASLSLFAGRPAAAQYGYGGGFGGYGGYGGYGGGMVGMGMTLADQEGYKYMVAQEGLARYNLMNAQTEQSYNYSYLMQQQAMNLELQNQRMAQEMTRDQYNLYSQAKNAALKAARDEAPTVPLSSLIDSAGQVRWPDVAPSGGIHGERRLAAEATIKGQYTEYVQNGRSSTTQTGDAKQALYAYGQPALDLLRVRRDTKGHAQLLEFLNALGAALDAMGAPPAPKEKDADSKPATTQNPAKPKSASDTTR